MPKENTYTKFKDQHKVYPAPIVIYADTKSSLNKLNKPVETKNTTNPKKTKKPKNTEAICDHFAPSY